jgi:hypothetical protein
MNHDEMGAIAVIGELGLDLSTSSEEFQGVTLSMSQI